MTYIDIDNWFRDISAKCSAGDAQVIRQAITLSQLAGEDYCRQGLAIASILNTLNVDSDTLSAAIVYKAGLDCEDMTEHLGSRISNLIQRAKQMDGISELYKAVAHHKYHHPKVDNIRKMLLAMVNDVRAVLIKLAEQLLMLREAKLLNERQKQQISQETMAIYAPLANRLGIGAIKWEMEDLAFRYLETEKYRQISQALNQKRVERERYVQQVIDELTEMLYRAGIKDMQVTGRVKHIYSIYRKIQRKNVAFSEIYDTTAVRVIVPTVEDCYTVLSNVHTVWPNIPEEFDDYIAVPKVNGYRSIHTAVVGPEDKCVEIQIRTCEMHEAAELGMAAHWVYKEGPQKSSAYEAKIAWLRQVMDWQQEITQIEDSIDEVQKIFSDRIYVFTPMGDIIDLPQGATVLDFAYQIHSEVGHRCRGAKVDGAIVNLTHCLESGNSVKILTRKESRPSRDWLNPRLGFLNSSRTRTKVRNWFRKQDFEKNIVLGQRLLEKELRRLRIKNINITDAARKLGFKISDELFAALGHGGIKINSIIHLLEQNLETSVPKAEIPTLAPARSIPSKKFSSIEILGVDNLLTHLANCCHPVPGDPIAGYITRGRGVSIHHRNCFNILRAGKQKPERLVDVHWGDKT